MFTSKDEANSFFEMLISHSAKKEWGPINKTFVHKLSEEQVLISDVVKLPDDQLQNFFNNSLFDSIYWSLAFPNFRCSFCFEHPLDHYPLMMLLEMGRQLGTAISHKFYDVPFKGYMGIADSIAFHFKRFIELDKPLYLICADSSIQNRRSMQRRSTEVSFLQEGIECAYGSGNLSVLSSNMYQKFRTGSRAETVGQPIHAMSEILTNLELTNYSKLQDKKLSIA